MEIAAERSGTVDAGNRRLAWRALGSGPPLLLVNGYAAGAADWDPALLAGLSGRFETICPDNRGLGASELGDLGAEPLTIDSMAADLEALLEALDLERAALAGWSMGGFIAQALALRAPRRVAALALLSTDPGGPGAIRTDPHLWARLTDDSGSPREQASRLISLLFPPPFADRVEARFGDLVAAARAELDPAALRAQEAAMAAWWRSEPPHPGEGAPPVLVAHGSADLVIPPENAGPLAARWPGARVERFPGGGHAFLAQEPARVTHLLTEFLK